MTIDFATWFLVYYFPPMVSNASPLLIRGSKPIDFAKKFVDNKPFLGRNKTWEGFVVAVYMGLTASIAVSFTVGDLSFIPICFGGSLFGVLGDLFGSFIKRRLDIKSGDPLPPLDQLDFAIFSTIFYYIVDRRFFINLFYVLSALLLITILHVSTNLLAYTMGLKDKKF